MAMENLTVFKNQIVSQAKKILKKPSVKLSTMAPALLLFIIVICAIFAPFIAPTDPYNISVVSIIDGRLSPGEEMFDGTVAILGTDGAGRDILSAVIYGLRTSLIVAIASACIALFFGLTVGLVSAFYGGRIDAVLMRIVDIQLSFPAILIALILLALLGKGIDKVIIALAIVQWAIYARTIRATAIVEIKKEYVEAAKILGLNNTLIIFKHVLPNSVSPLIVLGTLQTAHSISIEATLSFLGVGVPITQPSLGSLISNGFDYILSGAYWITFFPGLVLLATVAVINIFGDQLRAILNPRLFLGEANLVRPIVPNVTDSKKVLMSNSENLPDRLLTIKNLDVSFPTNNRNILAVRNVSLNIDRGEVLGIVGESGAGKSTIGNAIINIIDPPGQITNGEIIFQNVDIRCLSQSEMSNIRGKKIGIIFQDPLSALNPLMTIGNQLIETIIKLDNTKYAKAKKKAIALLNSVGIENAETRFNSYPHQFSGGMRQRVVVALALAGDPDLIIADEPTTALDVSIQAQILNLIKQLCVSRNLGVILITHDIGAMSKIADNIAVMYNGKIVETGNKKQILSTPKHKYTQSLISAVPRSDRKEHRFVSVDYAENSKQTYKRINLKNHWLGRTRNSFNSGVAISIRSLNKWYNIDNTLLPQYRKKLHAVNNVSLSINFGESFGIVGESGSGKSTIARLLSGSENPDSGAIYLFGREVWKNGQNRSLLIERRDLQMIFQDPFSSLNSKMRVVDIVAEPIRFFKTASSEAEIRQIVCEILEHVGISKNLIRSYPHEFSGGQRQRISIARALASRPKILICDEPTSALDVSVQANTLNLLKDLQDELGLTMLFISHDLPVIRQMCDRVAVMRHGQICEITDTESFFNSASHEYSKHLINLMPEMSF